jgi:RING/Ubox like zinc-binding domain
MEDSDFLCPLCCEELDISDRNFYPCKCGYQVCMWCWHRIRESESGTCPACRTPYGDDPHEFSAVDVEEVLRANREKAAMEKKMNQQQQQQLQQQQQQQQHLHLFHPTSNINSTMSSSMIHLNNSNNTHQQPFSNNTNSGNQGNANYHHNLMLPNYANSNVHNLHASSINHTSNHNVIPNSSSLASTTNHSGEDRTSLANMRVIRRNLVYAVGLPPQSEEVLRKPEYFGQYGKIQKIVLNRNHPPAGDARRPSASAYVTFCHKVSFVESCFQP